MNVKINIRVILTAMLSKVTYNVPAALRLLLLQTLTKTNLRNYFERQNCSYQIIFHEEQNSKRKPSNSVKLTVIILLPTCSAIGDNLFICSVFYCLVEQSYHYLGRLALLNSTLSNI